MKFQLDTQGAHRIERYGPGGFVIDGKTVRGSVLLSPSQIITNWYEGRFDALQVADFDAFRHEPEALEIILLGSGSSHRLLSPALSRALRECGYNVEAMSTDAACRTYSVLRSEDRLVAAALLPLDVD